MGSGAAVDGTWLRMRGAGVILNLLFLGTRMGASGFFGGWLELAYGY